MFNPKAQHRSPPHDITQQLALRAARGDEAAFGALLEREYHRIYRLAMRLCDNPADAEDLTQEVCIKLARVIGQFEGRSQFTTWLYRIVLNGAKDLVRQRRPTETMETHHHPTSSGETQEADVALRDVLAYLEACGGQLRETVLLVYGEGLTHAEAAAVLDCAESTVSWRLHKLKDLLKDYPQGSGGLPAAVWAGWLGLADLLGRGM